MTLIDILILLLVAGLAGVLAEALAGFSTGGFLVSIVLGFIGALVGLWIARGLSLPEYFTINLGGTSFPLLWSIIGATVVLLVLKVLSRAG